MHVRTTAADLARWLERRGGAWSVDGEPVLARSLPVPTTADSLANALRGRGGELVVLVPDACALPEDAFVGPGDLHAAAHIVEGQHVFQLAWVTPEGVRDSWLLAEHDHHVPSGDGEATAARIVAGLRQPWPTPQIARKR
jgi:hypothetical protein